MWWAGIILRRRWSVQQYMEEVQECWNSERVGRAIQTYSGVFNRKGPQLQNWVDLFWAQSQAVEQFILEIQCDERVLVSNQLYLLDCALKKKNYVMQLGSTTKKIVLLSSLTFQNIIRLIMLFCIRITLNYIHVDTWYIFYSDILSSLKGNCTGYFGCHFFSLNLVLMPRKYECQKNDSYSLFCSSYSPVFSSYSTVCSSYSPVCSS